MALMTSALRNAQRERFAAFLAHQRTCILSTIATQGVWTIPAWYRMKSAPVDNNDLELECLIPRWSDVAYHLTQDTRVVLIVQASSGAGLRWLQILGTARSVDAPDWPKLLPRWVQTTQPDSLYLVIRVTPSRIDLVDEDLGWGVQETLEW